MLVLPESQKFRIAGLFSPSLPSRVWLDAYLEDRVPGVAYVDSVSAPALALVVTEFHHITFVGWAGAPPDLTAPLASVLAQEVYLGLVWPAHTAVDVPQTHLAGRTPRLEFRSYAPTFDSVVRESDPGADLSFSPLDRKNFERCESKGECLYAYETRERFLKECFGVVAERERVYLGNAEVICQSRGEGTAPRADLQIVVSEPYRRTGIGLRLAQKLIEQVRARGIEPLWSCNKENVASEALARKLGFSGVTEFEILNYETQPGLQRYWVDVLGGLGASAETKVEVVRALQRQYEFNRMDAHWLVVTYLREREKQS